MDIREKALTAVKKHKSGWLKLSEALIEIDSKEFWKDWGYADFADYCKKELDITPKTAKNMIEAYEYIKAKEPHLIRAANDDAVESAYIPEYYSVNLLAKAKERGGEEGGDRVDHLHKKLFGEKHDSKTATEEIRGFLKECRGGGDGVMDDIKKEAKAVKRLAKKLVDKLHNTSAFPAEVLEAAEALEKQIDAVEVI